MSYSPRTHSEHFALIVGGDEATFAKIHVRYI